MSSSAAAARSSESTLQLPNATLLGAEAKGKGTAYHVSLRRLRELKAIDNATKDAKKGKRARDDTSEDSDIELLGTKASGLARSGKRAKPTNGNGTGAHDPGCDDRTTEPVRPPNYATLYKRTVWLQPTTTVAALDGGDTCASSQLHPALYPEVVDLDGAALPILRTLDGTQIGRIPSSEIHKFPGGDRLFKSGIVKYSHKLHVAEGVCYEEDEVEKAQGTNLTLHFRLELIIYIDVNCRRAARDLSPVEKAELDRLLEAVYKPSQGDSHAVAEVEDRIGSRYRSTDVNWFYACLPRPPIPPASGDPSSSRHSDRKGKGRARPDDDNEAAAHRLVSVSGLTSTLLPFQSRSLEWLLSREGQKIAGSDEEGLHYIGAISTGEAMLSTQWEQLKSDDGRDAMWINTLDFRISAAEPLSKAARCEGSILAEEMGLGKTVEILSLILLHRDDERSKQAPYLDNEITQMVQPSGLTLLVCPTAIVSQWMSEFKKHAPGLRVLRYEGMKETFPDSSVDNVQVALTYNVVLTTYDVFASEVKTARKPRIHNTRGKAHLPEHERVSYRRPLFVCLDWLRVVIDEAQMAASTTSAISETASLIPRKFSVAVSGTPIRQTIEDLAGLLQFLRIPEYGTDRRKFSRLLQPVNAEIFTRLISRIGIRTVKSQIQDELVLPDQSRFIVPVRLTRVELFNYKNRYQDAVTQLELAMNTTDFVTKDWSLDAATVTRWLHLLRQSCFHAAATEAQPVKAGQKVAKISNVVQSLEQVLQVMRDKHVAELHVHQRDAANAQVQRAYRLAYEKDNSKRHQEALDILMPARQALRTLAEDIHNELLRLLPPTADGRESRSRSGSDPANANRHSFLGSFRDTVKEAIEQAKEREEDTTQLGRRAAALQLRLREVVIVLHSAVFFCGNAHFELGQKEDEDAMYGEAETLRKSVLLSDEQHTSKKVEKMNSRMRAKPISVNSVNISKSQIKPGLRTASIFDNIEELSEEASDIGALMLKWRGGVSEMLSTPLSEDDVSAEEYQNKAEIQEKLDIHIEYLGYLENDWVQLVTGTRSALADQEQAQADAVLATFAQEIPQAQPVEAASKRSLYKQQAGLAAVKKAATAVAEPANPAAKLRYELDMERKKVVDASVKGKLRSGTSLKSFLKDLNSVKEGEVLAQEITIAEDECKRIRKILAEKEKVADALKSEMSILTDVYNARVTYYRGLQEFSDSVAELTKAQKQPAALLLANQKYLAEEKKHKVAQQAYAARRRFLEGLQKENHEDDCLICTATQTGQAVLTACGHIYHELCLTGWLRASGTQTCPVCRESLAQADSWHKISFAKKASLPEVKKEEGAEEADAGNSVNVTSTESVHVANTTQGPTEASSSRSAAVNGHDAALNADDGNPLEELNLLPARDLGAIGAVELRGRPLGSKLDTVLKHIRYLKDKHLEAIEEADSRNASSGSGAKGKGKGKERARDAEGQTSSGVPATDAKILVYSGWSYAVDVLASAMRTEGIGCVRLEGSSKTKRDREKAIIEFRDNPDCTVFILHAASQAAGLNLVSAQYVFLIEPLLQPGLEKQAIARVHRIGQRVRTTVFQYVVRDTVDERIALLSLKQGHELFSRAAASSTSSSQNAAGQKGDLGAIAAVPSAVGSGSGKTGLKRNRSESGLLAGEQSNLEDMSSVLLEREHRVNLQRILLKVAELRKNDPERAFMREYDGDERAGPAGVGHRPNGSQGQFIDITGTDSEEE